MKILICVISLGCIILGAVCFVFPAFASDISNAQWYSVVNVTNNGTAATNEATAFNLNSPSMIAQNFVNSTLTDVAMLYNALDILFMPGYNTNSWIAFVSTIGTSQTLNYNLYCKNVTGGSIRYFPGATGMTVTDNANLEIGSNGTIYLENIYIDTTQVGANFTSHNDSTYGGIVISCTASGQITSNITYNTTNTTEQNLQNTTTPIGFFPNYPRAGARLTNLPACTVTSISFYLQKVGAPIGTANITIRRTSDDAILGIIGTQDVATVAGVLTWYTWTGAVSNPTMQDVRIAYEYNGVGGTIDSARQIADVIAYSQFTYYSVGAWIDSPAQDQTYKITVVTYDSSIVSVSGISSGEYDISASLLVGTHTLNVGGTSNNTAFAGSIADSSTGWTFCPSQATTYIRSMSVSVNGTSTGNWTWSYGATFPDNTGNGNTATPSFRTTGTNANVSAVISTFQPVSPAYASAPVISSNAVFSSLTPPSQLYLEGVYNYIPGADAVNAILDASGTPRTLWWFPFIFIGIGIFGMMIFGATKGQGGEGSLLTQCIVCDVLLGLFGIMGPIMFFPCIIFWVPAAALILSRKHYGYG